jgi:hypothetical protein
MEGRTKGSDIGSRKHFFLAATPHPDRASPTLLLHFSLLASRPHSVARTQATMASSLALRRLFSLSLPTTTRLSTRSLSSTPAFRKPSDDDDKPSSPFGNMPSPPRLPKEEQEVFEKLQRQSTGAFSTPKVNQSPASEPAVKTTDEGEELHPDARLGPKAEFEGEKNPKTGEVGGPKNDPLKWGAQGDWSYSGRVTDF